MGGILKAQNTAWCGGWQGRAVSGAGESSWDTLGDGQAGNLNDVLCPCTSACGCESFVFKHLILLRNIYTFL